MGPVGLVAGSGRLPVLFAQAAARGGRQVVAAAHEGETDPALEQHVLRLSCSPKPPGAPAAASSPWRTKARPIRPSPPRPG